MGTDNIQVEAERTVPAVEPSEAAEKTKREASVQEGADAEHHERARSRYLMHQSFASSGIPTEVADRSAVPLTPAQTKALSGKKVSSYAFAYRGLNGAPIESYCRLRFTESSAVLKAFGVEMRQRSWQAEGSPTRLYIPSFEVGNEADPAKKKSFRWRSI